MNETLTVRDFGPIKEATVEFKRVTVFIGPTGGGKSTLAKLAAILKNEKFSSKQSGLYQALTDFNLGSYYDNIHSVIDWLTTVGKLSWSGEHAESDGPGAFYKAAEQMLNDEAILQQVLADMRIRSTLKTPTGESKVLVESLPDEALRVIAAKFLERFYQTKAFQTTPSYIPAERVFLSAISSSFAGLMRDDIGLPKQLLDFANTYAQAKREVTDLPLTPFEGVAFEHRNGEDFVRLPDRKEPLYLSETASGIQSVAPLLVVLEYLSHQTERSQSFIVEEPELNLYPEAQQALLNVLVEKCARAEGKNDLIITTHSPYLLSQLNLMLYAPLVVKNHPERAEEIKAIVPEASWIQPGDLAVYYVNGPEGKDGIRSLLDPETGLIAQNALDGTAGQQADAFDRLLDINSGF